MLDARVDSCIRFREADLPPRVVETLRRQLSFPNPAYVQQVRFQRSTRGISPELCMLREDGGELVMPRGAVSLVRVLCDARFSDHRSRGEQTGSRSVRDRLRPYQRRVLRSMLSTTQGCVLAPCGSGKTTIGVALIAELGRSAVVLVHTRDLADQWLASFAAAGIDAGMVGDGEERVCQVTVATVQTLVRRIPNGISTAGVVLVDEAHHTPASTFRQVLEAFPARWRYGLTATPKRSDGLTPLLQLCIGPTLAEVTHEELVKGGWLVVPEVRPVATGVEPASGDYAAVVAELVEHKGRNVQIVGMAADLAEAGRTVLVLSNRVDHCQALADGLLAADFRAAALTGKTPKARRASTLEAFRDGRLEVLCATSLADEGLDVPRLSAVILALPSRAEGRTVQRLGRLMRPHPGKAQPILLDLVDDHPITRAQWRERRRAYRRVLGSPQIPMDPCRTC